MRKEVVAGPGLINYIVYNFFIKNMDSSYPKVHVDEKLMDDKYLNIGKGFRIIQVPGHSEGQIALLYDDHGGFLFGADVATNLFGLNHPPLYENTKQGYDDLARIASLKFEGAVFGHGQPILKGADQKFVKKYGKNH